MLNYWKKIMGLSVSISTISTLICGASPPSSRDPSAHRLIVSLGSVEVVVDGRRTRILGTLSQVFLSRSWQISDMKFIDSLSLSVGRSGRHEDECCPSRWFFFDSAPSCCRLISSTTDERFLRQIYSLRHRNCPPSPLMWNSKNWSHIFGFCHRYLYCLLEELDLDFLGFFLVFFSLYLVSSGLFLR